LAFKKFSTELFFSLKLKLSPCLDSVKHLNTPFATKMRKNPPILPIFGGRLAQQISLKFSEIIYIYPAYSYLKNQISSFKTVDFVWSRLIIFT